jgi:hypothetical protein
MQYRLIKELPDFKVGEIFTKITDETDETYYISEHDDDWGLKRMYSIKTVENKPNFFTDASQPYRESIEDQEPESEIISVIAHDDTGTNERSFKAKLPKTFTPVTCKNCGAPNLIWVRSVKNNKAFLVRYDIEQKKYFAHWEECIQ